MRDFELGVGDLRDRLNAAVFAGAKTATTGLHASYLVENEPLPETGLYRLLDRDSRPLGVVEVTGVEVRRLGDIDDTVAHAEGEGYADAAAWRRSHEQFWYDYGHIDTIAAHRPGWVLDDDALVVVETFHRRADLLATERLLLRPMTLDDAEAFAAINADPQVMEHFTTGPMDRAASDAFLGRIIEDHAARGWGLAAVERIHHPGFDGNETPGPDGALLGFTGLHRHHWYPDDVEIGWRLGRAAWGAGYATEAATAWVRHAFDHLDLPRLISITVPENVRSIAVMRRLGFTVWEQTVRDGLEVVVHALTKAEAGPSRSRPLTRR